MKFIRPNKGFYCGFLITMFHLSLDIENADPFFSERDFRQNDFQTSRWLSTVFVLQNLDMMLGSLSRDK